MCSLRLFIYIRHWKHLWLAPFFPQSWTIFHLSISNCIVVTIYQFVISHRFLRYSSKENLYVSALVQPLKLMFIVDMVKCLSVLSKCIWETMKNVQGYTKFFGDGFNYTLSIQVYDSSHTQDGTAQSILSLSFNLF